ncbi:helix-turn-helix transcriptional regulator [Streptomyces sp. NPDC048191]|uniref:helix-turn-helix domain-containing protein n=1 Tax=Streptomyces sp. NPDC048191 TaxID=3155484 RepID=UPI0033EFA566
MSESFDAVDALVATRSPLPPPAERRRLRQAHALALDEVAAALQLRRATVDGWESGKTEPRPPEREAYARLLQQLATLYHTPESTGAEQEDTAGPQPAAAPAAQATAAAPSTPTASPTKAPPSEAPDSTATARAGPEDAPSAPPAAVRAPAAAPGPRAERESRGSRRPGATKAAPANTPAPGGVYPHGPLLVLDAATESGARCCGPVPGGG